jgi:hypothetical protein
LEERYGDLISAAYSQKEQIAIMTEVKYRDGRVGSIETNLKVRDSGLPG